MNMNNNKLIVIPEDAIADNPESDADDVSVEAVTQRLAINLSTHNQPSEHK